MRAKGVIFKDGFVKFSLHSSYRIFQEIRSVINLLSKGSVTAFDASIIGRFLRRKNKERDTEFCTSIFESRHKLGSSINLNRANREGRLFDKLY